MKFVYLSENKIYLWNDGKVKEIQSERVAHYTDTVRSINKSKEWKEVQELTLSEQQGCMVLTSMFQQGSTG